MVDYFFSANPHLSQFRRDIGGVTLLQFSINSSAGSLACYYDLGTAARKIHETHVSGKVITKILLGEFGGLLTKGLWIGMENTLDAALANGKE